MDTTSIQKCFSSSKVKKSNYDKLLEKKINFLQKKTDHKSLLSILHNNLFHCNSLEDYIKCLFTIPYFNKFKTIHLFIHEKGKSVSLHKEFTHFKQRDNQIASQDFNNLFNSIKKSKNRSYGNTELKGLNFEILGTFIGRECSLQNYNIILILSRDEFLPQCDDDIYLFNKAFSLIPDHFEIFLNRADNTRLLFFLKIVFYNSNIPYQLIGDKKIIASNTPIESFKCIHRYHFNQLTLEIGSFKSDSHSKADFYHKERISLLGSLLNTLKHELSNPLFGLKLTTDLLLLEDLNQEQKMFLEEINLGLDRCNEIISNFSNLFNNNCKKQIISLSEIVNDVLKLTKSITRGIKKEIEIDKSCNFMVQTHRTWVMQILFNLIINSAQELHSADIKGAKIYISITQNYKEFKIRISDNGNNINNNLIKEIFTPFYTTKEKGTGLGLFISRNLANKLSGKLEYITDHTNSGATFDLTLPKSALQYEITNN